MIPPQSWDLFPFIERHRNNRITTLPHRFVYEMAAAVRRETSHSMQSMPQQPNIFRSDLFHLHSTVADAYIFLGWNKICPGPQPSRCYQVFWSRLPGSFYGKELSPALDSLLPEHHLHGTVPHCRCGSWVCGYCWLRCWPENYLRCCKGTR